MNLEQAVADIRRFNRFYTSTIGLLNRHILHSPYSLSEARVLFEINFLRKCTARQIMEATEMDEGYLSRILKKLVKAGLVTKTQSPTDKRSFLLSLSGTGTAEFETINKASYEEIRAIVTKLSAAEVKILLSEMKNIETLLSKCYA